MAWLTGRLGESLNQLLTAATVCMAMSVVACTNDYEAENEPAAAITHSSVKRDGVVYTPMSIGPEGCLLYNIQIPGGDAPTAMVYQGVDGQFSFGRPTQCVKARAIE